MNSNDCKRFLCLNVKVQEIVAGRCGAADMENEVLDQYEIDYIKKITDNGRNPKKWKRVSKFKIGSKADMDDREYGRWYPEYVGCTAREFYLEDTDHVTILLITNDAGEMVMMDDLSD